MKPTNKKAKAVLGSLVIGAAIGAIVSSVVSSKEGKEVRDLFYQKWLQSRQRIKNKKIASTQKQGGKNG